MKRKFRFCGVILSGWLVFAAHVSISQGYTTPSEPSMLVQAYDLSHDTSTLYRLWPDSKATQLLTPDPLNNLIVVGINGQQAYFTIAGTDESHSNVYWTDGNQTVLLVENRPSLASGSVPHTPDMQWLLLAQEQTDGQVESWLFNTLTNQTLVISKILPAEIEPNTGQILAIDNDGWLYLTGGYRYWTDPHTIYRISLDDGTVQELTPDLVGNVSLVGYSADSDWLFYSDGRLYQMRRDGSDKHPLLPDTALDSKTRTRQWLYMYFPSQRIAFVGCKYGLCAVDVDSNTVLWSDDNIVSRLWPDIGATEWVLVRNDDLMLERLYITDGHREPIFPNVLERNANPLAFSPDYQWLIYGTLEGVARGFNLKRIHLETGEQQTIRAELGAGTFAAWSPDGQWIIWNVEEGEQGLYRVHISDGRFEQLTGDHHVFRGWFPSP